MPYLIISFFPAQRYAISNGLPIMINNQNKCLTIEIMVVDYKTICHRINFAPHWRIKIAASVIPRTIISR